MNQNHLPEGRENTSDDYSVRRSRKNNIIALIVCVFLAFALWLVIVNVTDRSGSAAPVVNTSVRTPICDCL